MNSSSDSCSTTQHKLPKKQRVVIARGLIVLALTTIVYNLSLDNNDLNDHHLLAMLWGSQPNRNHKGNMAFNNSKHYISQKTIVETMPTMPAPHDDNDDDDERDERGEEDDAGVDDGGEEDDADVDGMYYNLSCPFELHRFSCAFQGQVHKARESRALVEGLWKKMRSKLQNDTQTVSTPPLLPPRARFILLGDSLVRQVFSSLGCLLHAAGLLEHYWLNWPKSSNYNSSGNNESATCDNHTYHCIPSGQHSRFTEGVLWLRASFVDKGRPTMAEIHYQSMNHGVMAFDLLQQLKQTKSLSWSLRQPELKRGQHTVNYVAQTSLLTNRDILCLSTGVHDDKRPDSGNSPTNEQIYQTIAHIGNEMRVQRQNSNSSSNLPQFWYMTTSTQHFPTPRGEYVKSNESVTVYSRKSSCRAKVDANPRRDKEVKLLAGVVDHLIDYGAMDLQWGDHHLDLLHSQKHDCTHYCQPGPPDLAAIAMVEGIQQWQQQQQQQQQH